MFGVRSRESNAPLAKALDNAFLQLFMQRLRAKRREQNSAFQPPSQGANGPGLDGGRSKRMTGPIAGKMHQMNMETKAAE
jgi:hypothetical protein